MRLLPLKHINLADLCKTNQLNYMRELYYLGQSQISDAQYETEKAKLDNKKENIVYNDISALLSALPDKIHKYVLSEYILGYPVCCSFEKGNLVSIQGINSRDLPLELLNFENIPARLKEIRGVLQLKSDVSSEADLYKMIQDAIEADDYSALHFVGCDLKMRDKSMTFVEKYAMLESCGVSTPAHKVLHLSSATSAEDFDNLLLNFTTEQSVSTNMYFLHGINKSYIYTLDKPIVYHAILKSVSWQKSNKQDGLFFEPIGDFIEPVEIDATANTSGTVLSAIDLVSVAEMWKYAIKEGSSLYFRVGKDTNYICTKGGVFL